MPDPLSLNTIPQEVLEHIAFRTVTTNFLGPPTAIIPLLLTNRHIHSILSISSNPHFYARVFAFKYDVAPVIRHLGPEYTSATTLSSELQRRCTYLTRIRCRSDAIIQSPFEPCYMGVVHTILWMGYLMMLENKGKNEEQLRHYAKLDAWLNQYWFDPHGASFTMLYVDTGKWPSNNEQNSLAMWLFWFLLNPGQSWRRVASQRN